MSTSRLGRIAGSFLMLAALAVGVSAASAAALGTADAVSVGSPAPSVGGDASGAGTISTNSFEWG